MDDQKITQSVDNIVSSNADTTSSDINPTGQTADTTAQISQPAINPVQDNDENADSIEEALKKSEIGTSPSKEENPDTEIKPVEDSVVENKSSYNKASSDPTLDPIKKKALAELEPIIDELDLSAEEKFQTILMIIQTSDKKDLIEKAYDAADKIEDKKLRAQALLSVVKEIDYFENKN